MHTHTHDHNLHARNSHDCRHGHSHALPPDPGKAFLIGIVLNGLFVVTELFYGIQANALSLLADAGHNAGDVASLILAWLAIVLARRKPTARYTYGLQSASIMAALANACLLLVAVGGIAWEALGRLGAPQAVAQKEMMVVAAIGIVINGFTALLFFKGSKHDINQRGAYFHLAADAAISFGVVLSGALMLVTGWLWVDAVTSLVISFIIIAGSWGLLRDATRLALQAVPPHIDPERVRAFLLELPGVRSVHDLHIWAMGTTRVALTAHLHMENHPPDAFLHETAQALDWRFGIHHVTLQVEREHDAQSCLLASNDVI